MNRGSSWFRGAVLGGNGDEPALSMLMVASSEIFKPFMVPTLVTLKLGAAGCRYANRYINPFGVSRAEAGIEAEYGIELPEQLLGKRDDHFVRWQRHPFLLDGCCAVLAALAPAKIVRRITLASAARAVHPDLAVRR
jgi:hypothetical protein